VAAAVTPDGGGQQGGGGVWLNLKTVDATQIKAVAVAAKLVNMLGLALMWAWELDQNLSALDAQMVQYLHLGRRASRMTTLTSQAR
jgi:hypothetical protein